VGSQAGERNGSTSGVTVSLSPDVLFTEVARPLYFLSPASANSRSQPTDSDTAARMAAPPYESNLTSERCRALTVLASKRITLRKRHRRVGGCMSQNPSEQVHCRTPADPTTLPWARAIGLALAVGVAYFLAAQLSFALLARSDGLAMFWVAGGVSSGVLIAIGRSARLPIASGMVAAMIVAGLMGHRNIWISTAFALCNVGETILAAWLIERYFDSPFSLDSLRKVLGLLAAAVVATAASAVGATLAYRLFLSPTAPIWTTWQHWFASGAVGIITVAPLVIGLADALRTPPHRHEIIEGVVALAALAAVMAVIIILLPEKPWEMVAPVSLLFPILWLAARCQPVFAAAAAFIVSLAMVWATTFGIVHFGDPALPISDRILGTQAAILGVGLCAYILAALFAERRQHEAVLAKSETRLQEALATGEVMAFECNFLNGQIQRSENAAQILGFDPQQTFTAAQFLGRIHPDDRARFKSHSHPAGVDGPATVAFRFIRPDGPEVWLEKTSKADFDASGRLVGFKGVIRDITRRKQAQKRQDLLSAELDHRVKNVLARVGAVVRHTRRHRATIDEFIQALDGRIQSIAAAHALLSQSHWSGVGLGDLTRRQLAPYTTEANTTISGPEVMLTSAETQAIAMVIHELVTNAAKHGALSSPNGRVSVNWDRNGTHSGAILTITWRELGGPPITAERPGYGSNLIRDLIPHELGGTVDLVFGGDGLCCKIEIPLRARHPGQ
jgi:PAS domain S-box-containing protein